jgi:aminoglycoside phosphotransferase (APT) family kinase protein
MSATLRRADWRYLLPAPREERYRHLLLLGGPAGLADLLRAEEIAERIDTTPVKGADLVVAMADCSASASVLASYLSPGGVLYREIDRRRIGMLATTPARLAASLRASGLRPMWSHWVIPELAHARRYLPLDHAAALRWYFGTLHPAGSLPAALAAAIAHRLGRGHATGLAAMAPVFSVTACAGAERLATIAALQLPIMSRQWRASGTRVAMLTSGQDDGSRVVLLPFPVDGTEPDAVIKVSRTERFNAHTEREQATLCTIRSELDAELRGTIPEPRGTTRLGRSLVALESYAPGASMVRSVGRRGESLAQSIEDLRAAADWLARFHQRTAGAISAWCPASSERTVERLETFRARFAVSQPDHRLLDRAVQLARSLVGARLPTVLVHNDYGPWNIHRDGDRITVIDWELGPDDTARRGPALVDLIYFATEWHLRACRLRGRGPELRGFRQLFLEPTGPAARAASEAFEDYVGRVGVDRRFFPLLVLVAWTERALDRADRQVTATGSAATDENRYADYVRMLAAEADEAFWGGRQ